MKSWKTTLLGIGCFALCAWAIKDNLTREAYAFRYWQGAIGFAIIGLMGICSKDHSHKS